jgi:hypothetical protein
MLRLLCVVRPAQNSCWKKDDCFHQFQYASDGDADYSER